MTTSVELTLDPKQFVSAKPQRGVRGQWLLLEFGDVQIKVHCADPAALCGMLAHRLTLSIEQTVGTR